MLFGFFVVRDIDVMARICTAAEVKFYLDSYFSSKASSKRTNYLKPNKNCNLSSWVSGCEPGWACSSKRGQKVDYKNAKVIPSRTTNCRSCCEGFFCPHGITCMIRKLSSSSSSASSTRLPKKTRTGSPA